MNINKQWRPKICVYDTGWKKTMKKETTVTFNPAVPKKQRVKLNFHFTSRSTFQTSSTAMSFGELLTE